MPSKSLIIGIIVIIAFIIIGVIVWYATAGPSYVGCFADSKNRVLPNTRAGGHVDINTCGEWAKTNNYSYYGLQDTRDGGATGECWGGNTAPTTPASNCVGQTGAAWSLGVYRR
jgi:hypothetical protein